MEFSTDGTNTQDNEMTMQRKMAQYTYDWAVREGATNLIEPTEGKNPTTLWRTIENNLYRLTQARPFQSQILRI